MVAGVVAVLALLIYMVMFVKRNWRVITSSSASLWQKIVALGRRFYERDVNSHTFMKGRFRDRSMDDGINEHAAVEILENTNFPPRPSSNSSQVNNVLTNERGTPSAEQGLPYHVDEGCHKIARNVELTNVTKRDLSARQGTQPTAALGPPHHTSRECHCGSEGGSSSPN